MGPSRISAAWVVASRTASPSARTEPTGCGAPGTRTAFRRFISPAMGCPNGWSRKCNRAINRCMRIRGPAAARSSTTSQTVSGVTSCSTPALARSTDSTRTTSRPLHSEVEAVSSATSHAMGPSPVFQEAAIPTAARSASSKTMVPARRSSWPCPASPRMEMRSSVAMANGSP